MHLLTDKLWSAVEPHIPKTPPSKKGGRPRIGDRAAFTGILFVLRYAIPWDELPRALGYGSGTTCWRRLVAWQRAGVWDRIWQAMLADLNRQERVKWERVALDGSSIPAKKGAKPPARTPPIAGNAAQNTTSWSINKAYRSQRQSRGRMFMIPG